MTQTITLAAGQVSQIISVSPGTRITSSGNGYISWVAGSLVDAKNGSGTWAEWAKGSSAGYMDAVRQMCIRATATGNMTVTLDEGRADKYPENVYFDTELASVQTNADGSTSLLADSRDYPLIRWRESGAPDAQIVDTIGTAATSITFVTIPGGVMLPDSIIQIQHEYALTGNDGKTIALKATPASGAFADYAAATYAIGGQSGLTTQTAVGMITDIWNKGSLASQEATGYARPSPLGTTTSTTAFKSLNVDTSLDWNIWFYGQFAVANGAPSNTIRLKKYVITVIN